VTALAVAGSICYNAHTLRPGTEGAMQAAGVRNVTPISLIDGNRLTDLLIEHGMGVRKDTLEVVTFASERVAEEE